MMDPSVATTQVFAKSKVIHSLERGTRVPAILAEDYTHMAFAKSRKLLALFGD